MAISHRTNKAVWYTAYGYWKITVQRNGKRRQFYSSLPGRRGQNDCHQQADRWIAEGCLDDTTRVSVLFDRFIEDLQATARKKGKDQTYWRPIKSLGQNWIVPKIGRKSVGDVENDDLQDILDYAAEMGKAKKTIMDLRGCINKFLKFCRRQKTTTLIPTDLTIPDAKVGQKSTLQPDDLRVIFSHDKTTYNGEIITDWYINAYRYNIIMGYRPGEICGLKNEDVGEAWVKISRSLNIYNNETAGKNANARNAQVLPPLARKILDDQRKMLEAAGVESPYVFPAPDGRQTTQGLYKGWWERYREYHSLTKITPYELRHTFASVVKNLPEQRLKKVMRHSAAMDTRGTYCHPLDGEAEADAEIVNNIFLDILDK